MMDAPLTSWQCKIDAPQSVKERDPRLAAGIPDLPWRAIKEGIVVDNFNGPYAYVTYRPSAPSITGDDYEEELAYSKGAQVYYKGYFYEALADAFKFESPSSSPTKWVEVAIPRRWELALIELTYAKMIRYWAGNNKAEDHEFYRASTHARNVLETLINEEQGHIRNLQPVEVHSR